MEKKYILALDQGTTSSRAIIFDHDGNIKGSYQKEFTQIYPKAGYVEHDPMEILSTQIETAKMAMEEGKIDPREIDSIGITNQRETTLVWDKNTGKPVYNAIVWQCRRSAGEVTKLKEEGLEDLIKEKTGLVLDAYFSATKIKWILDNVDGARKKAENGQLLFGTIDSWLLYNLLDEKKHITDYSNASRTMIFNINTLKWDEELLNILSIPKSMLPEVRNSSEIYGETREEIFGVPIRIAGMAGDQMAALFGQNCFSKGEAKNTYGTGCFLLMNTGNKKADSKKGLLSTIAWGLEDRITYALEGSIFMGGASVQWLRDELKIIYDAAQTEYYANMVKDTNGVYVIPAFQGLGAPHWDMYARGTVVGLTRGVKREHLVRATLESIAYQSKDVLMAMEEDSSIELKTLKVDGGASRNNFLMQFQSDILGVKVTRPKITETTALGAAFLAGLATGFFKNTEEIRNIWSLDREFYPDYSEEKRQRKYRIWQRAIKRSMEWINEDALEDLK